MSDVTPSRKLFWTPTKAAWVQAAAAVLALAGGAAAVAQTYGKVGETYEHVAKLDSALADHEHRLTVVETNNQFVKDQMVVANKKLDWLMAHHH